MNSSRLPTLRLLSRAKGGKAETRRLRNVSAHESRGFAIDAERRDEVEEKGLNVDLRNEVVNTQ